MSKQPPTDTVSLEDKVNTALRTVFDPELGMNVVELGLIRKIELTPDLIEITMLLTTPFCPYGPALIEQARHAVEKATDQAARVTLAMELWDPSMMEGGAPKEWGLY